MTCIVACRVPGKGAVIACDSRVTAGTEIVTDACDKWMVCGTVALAIAGRDGGLVQALTPARSLAEVLKASSTYAKDHHELNFQIVAYERTRDHLWQLDSDGALLQVERRFTSGGSGGNYALGWLEACAAPKTLGQARKVLANAVRASMKRDCACGGPVRVLTVPGKRGEIVVQ